MTERYRHSYDVFPDYRRDQPFGSGATCSYNYLDLQITNQTAQTYQLLLYIEENHLVGEWRSNIPNIEQYRIYEENHHFTREWWGGTIRHNQIFREVTSMNGTHLRNEFITQSRCTIHSFLKILHTKKPTRTNRAGFSNELMRVART